MKKNLEENQWNKYQLQCIKFKTIISYKNKTDYKYITWLTYNKDEMIFYQLISTLLDDKI